MSVIAPCLTVGTEEEYRQLVERYQAFAERVQVDLSDGEFAPNLLLSPDKIWWPRNWVVDLHVMMVNPEPYLERMISFKPNLIILHAESKANLLSIIQRIKRYDIKVGIALLKPTVPETVSSLLKVADHALVFSGDLGYYGGVASLMQLEKIKLIKKINPQLEIGWDGGVNIENAFTLAQGGVDVLNVGGALAQAEDPEAIYRQLVVEINKQGII